MSMTAAALLPLWSRYCIGLRSASRSSTSWALLWIWTRTTMETRIMILTGPTRSMWTFPGKMLEAMPIRISSPKLLGRSWEVFRGSWVIWLSLMGRKPGQVMVMKSQLKSKSSGRSFFSTQMLISLLLWALVVLQVEKWPFSKTLKV